MTVFTDTWNAAFEALPADVEVASQGAGRIRTHKKGVRERLEVDHSWVGNAADGEHKKITFFLQTVDPSNVANKGFVYTKDANSKVELFWEDEDANVIQITSAGKLLLGEEQEGANVASAATPNIWTDTKLTRHITGTTGITGFTAAPNAGAWRRLIFDDAVLITADANLILQGVVDYTTATDDEVFVYAETTTQFKLLIFPKSGLSVVASGLPAPDFTSSEQTVDSDTLLNVAHGLGAVPTLIDVVMRCKTADAGYSVGDELSLSEFQHSGNGDVGVHVGRNATNVFIVHGTVVNVKGKSSFNATAITEASWKWEVKAWA